MPLTRPFSLSSSFSLSMHSLLSFWHTQSKFTLVQAHPPPLLHTTRFWQRSAQYGQIDVRHGKLSWSCFTFVFHLHCARETCSCRLSTTYVSTIDSLGPMVAARFLLLGDMVVVSVSLNSLMFSINSVLCTFPPFLAQD